jgi:hypothetical protein
VLQKQDRAFSLVECKASSFKPADSASKQARTFLLMAHKDSAEVFGMLPQQVSDTALAYLLPEPHREELQQTLSELEVELRQKGFRTGSFTMSINLTDTEWHEQLLRVLERFSCESMSASPEQQPELFEEE